MLREVLVGLQGRILSHKSFRTVIRAVALAEGTDNRVVRLELVADGPDRTQIAENSLMGSA
jgi:hypothetical protein